VLNRCIDLACIFERGVNLVRNYPTGPKPRPVSGNKGFANLLLRFFTFRSEQRFISRCKVVSATRDDVALDNRPALDDAEVNYISAPHTSAEIRVRQLR
jgi:hypothetical protein